MKPIELLGKEFTQIAGLLNSSGIEEVFDDLEEDEEQFYSVSAKDKSWELKIGNGNIVEAVFLYLDYGFESFEGVSKSTTREEILIKYGTPARSGDEREVQFLGRYGAWDRYNYGNYCVHFEHEVGSNTVKKITVMLSEGAA